MRTRIGSGADLGAGAVGGVAATLTMDAAMVLAAKLVGSMLLGHVAFGAGIGLWAATRRRG